MEFICVVSVFRTQMIVNHHFFTKGVCFNYGYDTELEVISDQEFVWLIEDTCNIYGNL